MTNALVLLFISKRRVCGTRIRVEMSSGRSRRDDRKRSGGGGGSERGGERGGDRGGDRGGGGGAGGGRNRYRYVKFCFNRKNFVA